MDYDVLIVGGGPAGKACLTLINIRSVCWYKDETTCLKTQY
jgi:hypothetical protein